VADETQQFDSEEPQFAGSLEVRDRRGRVMRQLVVQWRTPVTFALIIANVLVFWLYNVQHLRVPAELAYAPDSGQAFPQLLTYMFVHGSAGHILGNMLAIFFFGRVVEMIYGSGRYLLIYLLTGIAAALIQDWVSPAALIGASGAASAPMVIFTRHFPRAEIHLYFVLPMPAWIALALWVGFNLLGTQFNVWGAPMAYVAHLAGLAVGLLLSLLIVPPGSRRASRKPGV
jgi:membrane associated rhomboid family serine protease